MDGGDLVKRRRPAGVSVLVVWIGIDADIDPDSRPFPDFSRTRGTMGNRSNRERFFYGRATGDPERGARGAELMPLTVIPVLNQPSHTLVGASVVSRFHKVIACYYIRGRTTCLRPRNGAFF